MHSWREIAADVMANGEQRRPPRDRMPSFPIDGLPADAVDGLRELARLSVPPRVRNRAAWAVVVSDALRLVKDGWASTALGFGWTLYDLFGVGPTDSHEFSGLAVWLEGRRVLMLDADRAVAIAEHGYAYFNRGGFGHGAEASSQPVLLWQFGRV